jgi:protein-tyrosine phosphatase
MRMRSRCQAGVNRSGLVMALTLMRHGLSATDAISVIRERCGPAALSNRHFVRITVIVAVLDGPDTRLVRAPVAWHKYDPATFEI